MRYRRLAARNTSKDSSDIEAFPDFEPGKQYPVRSAPRRPIPATLARATTSAQYQWVGSQPQHSKLVKPAPKLRMNRFKYGATGGVEVWGRGLRFVRSRKHRGRHRPFGHTIAERRSNPGALSRFRRSVAKDH
jgi:hypothetical protein